MFRGVHELRKTNFMKLSGQFVFTMIDRSHTHTPPKKTPRKKPIKNLLKIFKTKKTFKILKNLFLTLIGVGEGKGREGKGKEWKGTGVGL
jgi:hypothetical protein